MEEAKLISAVRSVVVPVNGTDTVGIFHSFLDPANTKWLLLVKLKSWGFPRPDAAVLFCKIFILVVVC